MERAARIGLTGFSELCLFLSLISASALAQSRSVPYSQPSDFYFVAPAFLPVAHPVKRRDARSTTTAHRAEARPTAGLNFASIVDYGSGGVGAYAVAVGDVNGDGNPDLVVANQSADSSGGNGSVGVLLGNGDGTFRSAVPYASGGYQTQAVALADLNVDGKLDLVVTSCCGARGVVGVLLGNGDGTFQPVVTYDSGGFYALTIAVADLNHDGHPDLMVANANSLSVGVLLGNGDGTFQAAVSYGAGGIDFTSSVAVGDVNGDGNPDLLAVNEDSTNLNSSVGVLLGNSDGTFQTAVPYVSGGTGADSVSIADLNGDGVLDLVVANCGSTACNSGTGVVGVLLGNGDGTFQSSVPYGSGGTATNISVAIADIDGDGKPDLICANDSGLAGVLLGNGDGTFQTAVTYSAGPGSQSVAAADVNKDGKIDLLVAIDIANSAGVLLNTSTTATTTALQALPNPSGFGQAVTFTATVTTLGSGIPTGTVTFTDGTTTLGTSALNGSGVATFSTNGLAVGSHSVTAAYGGDSNFSGSASPIVTQTVNQASTTVAVVSTSSPAVYNQSITFTATISPQFGGSATGTVNFMDGATPIGSSAVGGNSASLITNALAVGLHSIVAIYVGDSNFAGSQSPPLPQVVNPASTTTVLTSNPNPSVVRQAVLFTATVAGQFGGSSTGSVTFKSGTVTLGVGTVTAGVATVSVSFPTMGTKLITAAYSGDTNFRASTSAKFSQTVTGSFTGLPYAVGPIVAATTTTPEAEETVVTDPSASPNLVAAITDFSLRVGGAGTNKYSVSNNSGATWSDSFIPLSSGFPITSDGVTWQENRDPSIAVDKQENVYLSGVYQLLASGQKNVNPAAGVYVCHGTLPSVVFTSTSCHPVFAFTSKTNNPFSEDKPSIATDNSSGATSGNVYVTWVHFTNCTKAFTCKSKFIAFSRSIDHGTTWSAPFQVSIAGTNVQWPQIVVGTDGTIYVAFETVIGTGTGQHFVSISTNGGLTFGSPIAITPTFQELSFTSSYRKNSGPGIAVSPVLGAEYLYDVYAVQTQSTVSNVQFVRSKLPKGAGGFTTPFSMNDSTSGQRLFPAAAVDTTGTLHVAWLDSRNSFSVAMYDVYATYSQNLGVTFAPNARVTPALINAGTSQFIGDYMGLTVDPVAGVAHPVWSNTNLQTTTLTIH